MFDERWHVTREQAELIVVGVSRGSILLTSPGSDNDILWGEFSDCGWMEPADAPKGLEALHAWKFTDAGRSAINQQFPHHPG